MSAKIRSGDDVIVLTGRDRGKIGKVIKIVTCSAKRKAVISGINVHKKHAKPKAGSSGGIINKELAIDISNIAILDPKYKAPTRVGFKVIDSKKVRFAKVSGEVIG
ncbi:50S ribosomal protein L24 [Wolbachia endosymbiont of Brugia pahangi]|uniref:50S ribosomal protein L24 n=1 Tax=Wolbachia endosymbiont of Brugia pahangi TaxID=96495 RepID=UPI001435D485|nr:50S ribosomal protein L24 [Wolbachia endosymbiont of Brugia pahangi]QIT35738.1 ribosomal protein L24 [Wolbachia endosymbiont of Brugia pahangi]